MNYIQTFWNTTDETLREREQRAERETHTSRDCFLVFLCCEFFVFFCLFSHTYTRRREEATPLPSTIPYRMMGFLPPRREEELSSFSCFSCSSRVQKKKKRRSSAADPQNSERAAFAVFASEEHTNIRTHTHIERKSADVYHIII